MTDAYGVPGLVYIPNFITPAEEAALIEAIDAGTWDTSLKRRVQHFGLRYDYTSKSVDKNAKLDPLPDFFSPLVQKVDVLTLFERSPEQCIVNGARFALSPLFAPSLLISSQLLDPFCSLDNASSQNTTQAKALAPIRIDLRVLVL